jgi:hypothetical protein
MRARSNVSVIFSRAHAAAICDSVIAEAPTGLRCASTRRLSDVDPAPSRQNSPPRASDQPHARVEIKLKPRLMKEPVEYGQVRRTCDV